MAEKKNDKQVAKNNTFGNNNINIQNSNLTINKGMDQILELARNGNNESALRKLGMFQRCFNVMHPLYPYYKYNINMNENGVSIGMRVNSENALEKYPPHGKVKFIIPDEYKWAKNIQELIRYGYEKQVIVELKAEYIQLWLGDYLEKDIKNISKVKIIPERFPDPIPMRFEFENTTFGLNYLEMALTRIDGEWLTISNEKQKKSQIILTLNINFYSKECKFNVKINDEFVNQVDSNLKFNKFLINMRRKGEKSLILLQDDNKFISFDNTTLNDYNYENIEKEMDFLERLKKLEEYYEVKFILPKDIYQNDYNNMLILEKTMNNESIEGKYEEVMLKITVDSKRNQAEILSNIGIKLDLAFENEEIYLFGQTIKFKEKWISYYNAVIENYDKVSNKIKYADNGDIIKVIYKPEHNKENKLEVRYIYK